MTAQPVPSAPSPLGSCPCGAPAVCDVGDREGVVVGVCERCAVAMARGAMAALLAQGRDAEESEATAA